MHETQAFAGVVDLRSNQPIVEEVHRSTNFRHPTTNRLSHAIPYSAASVVYYQQLSRFARKPRDLDKAPLIRDLTVMATYAELMLSRGNGREIRCLQRIQHCTELIWWNTRIDFPRKKF